VKRTDFPQRGDTGIAALGVDIHSHLLPGIDDGSADETESLRLIGGLARLGYRKLILTPHIYQDFYDNTNDSIRESFRIFKKQTAAAGVDIELAPAAEYFLDAYFMGLVNTRDVLTFGDRFVLVEMSLMQRPAFLEDIVFRIVTKGCKPVLAHPERYLYLQEDYGLFGKLKDAGLLFQLNLMSLHPSGKKGILKAARWLVEQGMVDFAGTDLHRASQLAVLEQTIQTPHFRMLFERNHLRNHTLL